MADCQWTRRDLGVSTPAGRGAAGENCHGFVTFNPAFSERFLDTDFHGFSRIKAVEMIDF